MSCIVLFVVCDSESHPDTLGQGQGRRSAGLGRTRLFHPWGREPEGGEPSSGVPCRTLSDLDYSGLRSVTCDVSSRWVLTTVQ